MATKFLDIPIVNVKVDDDYNVFSTFADGKRTLVNFRKIIDKGPAFSPLKNLSTFKSKVELYGGTIAWDVADGDPYQRLDFAPEFFYDGEIIN
jgi:hypothetical protein